MAVRKNQNRTTANRAVSKKTGNHGKGKKKTVPQKSIFREIAGFVCLFIAVFLILGIFSVDGLLIEVMTDLVKGFIGSVGFYILPLALLWAFFILLTHGGRQVSLRLICTFAIPVAMGALVHIFIAGKDITWGMSLISDLYVGGIGGETGGLISGFFAMFFSMILSKIGAGILFVLVILIGIMGAINMTVSSLIHAIHNRPRLEPVPEKREKEPVDTATFLVNHVAEKRIARVEKKRACDFDLPVDEPPLLAPNEGLKTKKAESILSKTSVPPVVQTPMASTPVEETPVVETGEVEKVLLKAEEQFPPIETKATHLVKPVFVKQGITAHPIENAELVVDAVEERRWEAVLEPKREIVALPKVAPVVMNPMPELIIPSESKKVRPEEALEAAREIVQEIAMTETHIDEYHYPPVSLLNHFSGSAVDGTEEMRENTDRLNNTLASFGIDAHIVNVTRGPSVTRYELELDRGVKLSKVTNLADDIALSLGATGVRISAIPNKISVVGIEVPNRMVSTVVARDVLDSKAFTDSKSKLSFAIGKDIGGNTIVGNIAKLPHMLIAGTTGSGKSVCMNSLIISLLFKSKPDEVRMIMVDPKMVELGIYNGIPHLLIPVVTDPKKAAGALQWAVVEMLRRYRMMADAGVRDLESYNKIDFQIEDERKPMEQIVVVIDELADLMLVAAKEVEESICRIAQMGRASGIHLVIAIQRPSADVITGLMKANIPSRIAFAVASSLESRIILDTQGAEKLVGKGDMLYAPLGQGKPQRVQGCFITDEEVQAVVEHIKQTSTSNYSDEVQAEIELKAMQGKKSGSGQGGSAVAPDNAGDELLSAAVDVILETGQASVSMLQRRLKLGYARAARIVDEMEDQGIVGPFEGSKPRQLLITREQWEALQSGEPLEPENPAVEEELM